MTEESTITIEVDGRALKAAPGAMLIDVCDAAGIHIPRFCYHRKLSLSANCRMCLVEVEKVPRPLPACVTPVNDGMKVTTNSPMAVEAQKGAMEFLLINHPLDCPICDQGGECELQDVALGYGSDASRYAEAKRVVADPDIGPLVATDLTRCIHCTRCVRFGAEIAGIRELGATGRGDHMTIGTYVEHAMGSELAGNVIDLCPVGALTSKPFRFQARAWEMVQRDGIAAHDGVGSNVHYHLRRDQILRVHPKDNEAVNECWLSDRDRFSYQALSAADRLLKPLVKQGGEWRETDWQSALEAAAQGLAQARGDDGNQLGGLLSPSASLEELYLAKKLMRGLGSANLDHRLRQADFRGDPPKVPWLGGPIAELEEQDLVVIIGANPRKDQPLLGHRIRKAAMKGAEVVYFNPLKLDLNYRAAQWVANPRDWVLEVANLAKAAGVRKGVVNKIKVADHHKELFKRLKAADKALVLVGDLAMGHPDYGLLRCLAAQVAEAAGARLGFLTPGANGVGAALLGVTPGEGGLDAQAMLAEPRKGYLLLGIDPGFDLENPAQGLNALMKAECVVALSSFRSPDLETVADVILPLAAAPESAGTFFNIEGTQQGFNGAAPPAGEARPGWKILRVLGNLMNLGGFDFNTPLQVRDEALGMLGDAAPDNGFEPDPALELTLPEAELLRIGELPIYSVDPMVRRAPALQATADAQDAAYLRLNPEDAKRLGFTAGDRITVSQPQARKAVFEARPDPAVPQGAVALCTAIPGSQALAGRFGEVTLEKA